MGLSEVVVGPVGLWKEIRSLVTGAGVVVTLLRRPTAGGGLIWYAHGPPAINGLRKHYY